ncbi:MAG: purine-binding chemotaxis protein CheW [Candidatus Azotimanducaceae bacterium]|jgi:purine-binding chemotaxis protein CheW
MNMQAQQNIEDPILQWVTFRLDGETYGVNVMQVQEVLRYTEIAPVPGAPDYVLGIINLRGNVVTVIDTRNRFALTEGEITDSTRIVIVETDEHVVGLLVDSVAEVVYLRQSEIESPPNAGHDDSARFIQGVCNKNEELLILIELEKILTEVEWSDVEHA